MTTCTWAKKVAQGCLVTTSHEYLGLSQLMCWDAAIHVGYLAGIIDDAGWRRLKDGDKSTVLDGGVRIRDADAIRALAEGHLIYFKHGQTPIHAMVSTGQGYAAGNKNNCIGVGRAVGWEQLNLADDLDWGGELDILAPGLLSAAKREVTVHAFPMTELAWR